MYRILCYGDSNTWGYDRRSTSEKDYSVRYDENVRWPKVMGRLLGEQYTILEAGVNGRTTVFEDPLGECKNGLKSLEVTFSASDPIDLVIFMLGTNDTKDRFHVSAEEITEGMERLISTFRVLKECSMSKGAQILLVSPIKILPSADGGYLYGFSEKSTEKSEKFPKLYQDLAKRLGCGFLQASSYAAPCSLDGVHLDEENHEKLGKAMVEKVKEIRRAEE